MSQVIEFIVLGFGLSAVYALLGSGILLIYQGSGVVNFAQGAFALVGASVMYELRSSGVSVPLALLAALAAGVVIGAVMQNVVMVKLRTSSPVTRVVATLAVLIILEAVGGLHYGATQYIVAPYLPNVNWHVAGVLVPSEQVILLAIAGALGVTLAWLQKHSVIGLAMRGVAENEGSMALLGWSPNVLANASWMLGCALATLAGALIVPVSGLIVDNFVLFVVPALAAALLGRFASYGLMFGGALVIGITQSLVARYWSLPGVGDAVPFLAIILVVTVTGSSLPLRSHASERLPSIGRGLLRPGVLVVFTAAVTALVIVAFNVVWTSAFTVSAVVDILVLSVVVITGYAGQVSLAQYALAGLGAFVAGRLVATQGWPFWAAFLAGIAAAVPIGAVFALPAVRTRGVTLAVVTLGLGVAVNSMIFNNTNYVGGLVGTQVGPTKLFGWDIDALAHPQRYALFAFALLMLAAIGVTNLRRSSTGRRLIAIRENERAAASLGISVANAKLYAFSVGSVLAAVAGIVSGFTYPSVDYTQYTPLQSVDVLGFGIIGGVGYVPGAFAGGILTPGGIGSLLNLLLSGIKEYLPMIGGAGLLLTVLLYPDGVVPGHVQVGGFLHKKLRRTPLARVGAAPGVASGRRALRTLTAARVPTAESPHVDRSRVEPLALDIEGLTVRFGGTVAVNDVSLTVAPGQIMGVIGPNGAGKTTLIDAVTGFVQGAGSIRLGERALQGLPPARRARAGVARSWQSLELFEDVTVLENLQVASESRQRRWWHNLQALLWPPRSVLTAAAVSSIAEFELDDDLTRLPRELSYGRRRLVGIARAVALNPSVLLLDEPAAGLSEAESAELGTLIRKLADLWGMGILLVEHDVKMVLSCCDRVAVLNFGSKIAEGTPEEVQNDPAVVAAYLGTESHSDQAGTSAGATAFF